MPIADLTRHNPFEIDRRQEIAAAGALGQSLGNALEKFPEAARRAEERALRDEEREFQLRERNIAIADREKKREDETFGELNQAASSTGPLGAQMSKLAFDDKKKFVELTTELDDVNTSSERRAEIRNEMGIIGGRAKSIASMVNKVNENAQSWDAIRTENGISDATPPGIRDFMMDIINRENEGGYHIIVDEETGKEKFIGETSNGYPVDFFVEDVANGTNTFRAIPKMEKNEMLDNLVKEIPLQSKVIQNSYGLAQYNDSELAGKEAAKLIMGRLDNEEQYRGIAADYGFGFEELEAIKGGLGSDTVIEEGAIDQDTGKPIDIDGDGVVSSEEELKGYLANRLLQDVSSRIPTGFKQLNTDRYKQNLKNEQTGQKPSNVARTQEFLKIASNPDSVDRFKGKKIPSGTIQKIQHKNGKVQVILAGSKKGNVKGNEFDLNDPDQYAAFTEYMGYDPNVANQTLISTLKR